MPIASHPDKLLTPREHSVMELVTRGANDDQIAELLIIARQTVPHHVRNVCQKLGAANRTAAAVQYDLRYGRFVADAAWHASAKALSSQEQRVIASVAKGLSDPQIAMQLNVAASTVRQHLLSIRRKLHAPNRTAAAVEYYRYVRRLAYIQTTGSNDEG